QQSLTQELVMNEPPPRGALTRDAVARRALPSPGALSPPPTLHRRRRAPDPCGPPPGNPSAYPPTLARPVPTPWFGRARSAPAPGSRTATWVTTRTQTNHRGVRPS